MVAVIVIADVVVVVVAVVAVSDGANIFSRRGTFLISRNRRGSVGVRT